MRMFASKQNLVMLLLPFLGSLHLKVTQIQVLLEPLVSLGFV